MFFLAGIITGILYLHVSLSSPLVEQKSDPSSQETLESKRDQKDYGLVLGQKLNTAVKRQLLRAKNLWHRAKGEETEPLLKHAVHSSSTTDREDDDDDEDARKPRTELARVTVREVMTVQSMTNLAIYTILATHSLGYDQVRNPSFLLTAHAAEH